MATDAYMYCQVRDDMGGLSEFKTGKSPKEMQGFLVYANRSEIFM